MLSVVKSMALNGLDGYLIEVQTDVSSGLPSFDIVGLPDISVKEAKERIRVAIKNSKIELPSRKYVIKTYWQQKSLMLHYFVNDVSLFFMQKNGFKRRWKLMRTRITLACTECKQRNYSTTKEKKNHPDRMEMKKYCKFCKTHTLHKETK